MINSRALANSSTVVVASTFALCGAFIVFSPGALSSFVGWVLHIDLSTMARPISVANYTGGLVVFAAFVWLLVAMIGTLYNRFTAASPVR